MNPEIRERWLPGLSRITDDEMKKLMIGASAKLAELLSIKENNPEKYWKQMVYFHKTVVGSGRNNLMSV